MSLRTDWRRICPAMRLLLVLVLLPGTGQSQSAERLGEVLDRMRVSESQHFDYQEVRYVQLLAEPARSAGDLYVSPTRMVIAQRRPSFVATVITANRMLHINEQQDIHRSLKLKAPFAVPGIEPLMHLFYGDAGHADLARDYVFSLGASGERWVLQLIPRRQGVDAISRMQVSGRDGEHPDRLSIEYADGDRTEWQLTLTARGTPAEREMRQVIGTLPAP